jgi:hypothetical protein
VRSGGAHGVSAELRQIALRCGSAPGRPSRFDKLVSPAIVFVCYWHPAYKRGKCHHTRAYISELVTKIAVHFTAQTAAIIAEFNQIHHSKPDRRQGPCNLTEYVDYWSKICSYPLLVSAIIAIAKIHPTEADCERAFSGLKWMFNRLRTTAGEDLVEATVCGASAVNFLTNCEITEDTFTAPRVVQVDEGTDPTGFASLRAEDAEEIVRRSKHQLGGSDDNSWHRLRFFDACRRLFDPKTSKKNEILDPKSRRV